jgi:glycosyltransferase involved in cell wall biosynthesis
MDGTPMYYAKHGLWYAHPAFDPDSISARWKKSITRSVYAGAFHLLPFSEGVRESLVEDYGIPEEKVTVLPPGVDMSRYVVPPRHERPGKDDSYRLKVLFVGADFPRKGGDLLASLAGREEFADLEFHFVTKSLVRPVGKNVVVHSELSIDSEELIALYRDADIFVLPTRADSHSLAMLEAMAVGLPAISTKIGALDELIIEGETGFLLPPDDIHGLANRLHTLVETPSLRLAMGRNARKRAEEHFNLAKNAEVILTMLEQAAMTRAAGVI